MFWTTHYDDRNKGGNRFRQICVLSRLIKCLLCTLVPFQPDSSCSLEGLPCFKLTVLHVKHVSRIKLPVPKLLCCSNVWCPIPERHPCNPDWWWSQCPLGEAINTEEMAAERKILLPFIPQEDSSETKILKKVLHYVTINSHVPLENTTLFCFDLLSHSPSSFLSFTPAPWDQIPKQNVYTFVSGCFFLKDNLD